MKAEKIRKGKQVKLWYKNRLFYSGEVSGTVPVIGTVEKAGKEEVQLRIPELGPNVYTVSRYFLHEV